MAFATNQFIDGEWTTRTVDVIDVLRHYNEQDAQQETPTVETVPVLGILSQTVLKSPLAHWILPVKARHFNLNDVAFIGDSFVQIKELRPDGHLWDVIRRDDFGARIRNARVWGSLHAYERNPPFHGNGFMDIQIEDDDGDVDMRQGESESDLELQHSQMPPQLIILYLENLDVVFLILRKASSGQWEFISSRYRCNEEFIHAYQPGTHLTVDPSSRYIAIGPQEGTFAVLALHPRKELEKQYAQGNAPCPVESEGQFLLTGTIHKMEFLYPSADDEDHIILLVLHIFHGRTRMLVYDWMAGDDLRRVKKDVGKGHMLAPARQIPLLLIPLPIKSSFILISEVSLAVCKDILIGQPKFEEFPVEEDEPTALHHGLGKPLWTAWTRPYRFPYFKGDQDCIYIVREDGVIRCLEIYDDDSLIQAEMNIGHIQSNCGTALASLDYHYDGPRTGDYLITGGDSGAGAAYLIKARELPVFQQLISNWSPASDFVTTSRSQDREAQEPLLSGHNKVKRLFKPDKIYACTGKGSNGAILEHRYGLEANVGLDMEFEAPIENIWVLAPLTSLDDNTGSLFLLSLGRRSALLQLASDAGSVRAVDESETGFDLRYRTITAGMHGNGHIHVTEKSIVLIEGLHTLTLEGKDIFGVYEGERLVGYGTQILHAVIHENIVLFTTQVNGATYLLKFKPIIPVAANDENESLDMVQTLAKISSDITSLTTYMQGSELFAIAVVSTKDLTKLVLVPVDGSLKLETPLPMAAGSSGEPDLGTILNISTIVLSSDAVLLLCGTSNGYVVMAGFESTFFRCVSFTYDRIGLSTAHIRKDEYPGSQNRFFGNCDSKLYAFTIYNFRIKGSGRMQYPKRTIHRIYLTDAQNSNYTQPEVNSIAKFLPHTLGGIDDTVLITAGSLLLVAGLSLQPKPVPRRIPIGGTPLRLLYSHNFELLVVAANVKEKKEKQMKAADKNTNHERSTLFFIDPETGEDVSKPFDTKANDTVEFITGLGMANDKIFRLIDWTLVKDGKTWNFIILCTSSGRLVLVSAEREGRVLPSDNEEAHPKLPRLRYWMRHVFKCGKPIYCVTSFPEGLIYCSGTSLHCDVLDLEARKFKSLTEYELPSPAINVVYEEGGRIYVLTSTHSLEILKLVTSANGGRVFVRTHGDQVTRDPLHHKILESLSPGPPSSVETPLHLVSDREASVTGLWAISNTKADTLETLFEAQLPYSILKLRYGKCRPIWDPTWASNGANKVSVITDMPPNSANYPEVLGISLNGSLSHFTIIDHNSWKFLRFLVNVALQSPKYCESLNAMQNPKRHVFEETFKPKQDVSKLEPVRVPHIMMHVDGDILKQCLERQLLEGILQIEATTEAAAKIHEIFRALLNALLSRGVTESIVASKQSPDIEGKSVECSNTPGDDRIVSGNTGGETIDELVYEAYQVLQAFLRPVL